MKIQDDSDLLSKLRTFAIEFGESEVSKLVLRVQCDPQDCPHYSRMIWMEIYSHVVAHSIRHVQFGIEKITNRKDSTGNVTSILEYATLALRVAHRLSLVGEQ